MKTPPVIGSANIVHAFETAAAFAATNAQSVSGNTTVIAHSLGNVLVSSAVQDHGFRPARYFMFNAAVPAEAFDASAWDEGGEATLIGGSRNRNLNLFSSIPQWPRHQVDSWNGWRHGDMKDIAIQFVFPAFEAMKGECR